MRGHSLPVSQQTGPKQDMLHAAAALAKGGECCTLTLDRAGRILGCGALAEKIFGASHVQLIGRPVSDFIAGLLLAGSSPSYNARYLVYLCADGVWRSFAARDASGHEFAVDLNLSRIMADGQEFFLMNLRCPE